MKQASVETSTFGLEFIVMKQCCKYVQGFPYNLRIIGIPVEEPTYVFRENKSVLANTSVPHSVLKKKSSSITYHFVHEGVAKDALRTAYLHTDLNPAHMGTKPLPEGIKKNKFFILSVALCGMISSRECNICIICLDFAAITSFTME